jgi:hypothetical protein
MNLITLTKLHELLSYCYLEHLCDGLCKWIFEIKTQITFKRLVNQYKIRNSCGDKLCIFCVGDKSNCIHCRMFVSWTFMRWKHFLCWSSLWKSNRRVISRLIYLNKALHTFLNFEKLRNIK